MFRRGTGPGPSAADAERQALFEKLAQRPETVCPFLGLATARADYDEQATDEHRCFAFGDPEPVSGEQQRNICLQRGYANCPRYLRGVLVIPSDELEALRHPPQKVPPPPPPPPVAPPPPGGGGPRRSLVIVLLLLLLIGGGAGVWWLVAGQGPVAVQPSPSPSEAEGTPTATLESSGPSTSPPEPTPVAHIVGPQLFQSLGSAVIDGANVRMTTSAFNQSGSAWYPDQVIIGGGFNATFSIQITEPLAGGGDGVAFVVQGQGPDALGGSGEQVGYGGIRQSLAVEFDTFLNDWPGVDDPNDNHVSVNSRGKDANTADHAASLALGIGPPPFSDGRIHPVTINYIPGTLTVLVDGISILSVNVDLAQLLGMDSGRAWIGFTASTGESAQLQTIGSVDITFP